MKHLEILEQIRKERRRGSTALAYMVLDAYRALAEVQDLETETRKFAEEIEKARPAMPLIARFSREIIKRISTFSRDNLLAVVEDVEKTYRSMMEKIVSIAVENLKHHGRIATLSHSGTISLVLQRLRTELVCVLESRPLCEGLLLASELEKYVEVKVFVDAAMAYAVQECDAVVVGADALFEDGSFAGKVGVKPLALVAKNLGKPFYVVCDTWKHSDRFVNEFGPAEEISSTHAFENPIFETVEPEFVTAFLTEKKAVHPHDVVTLLEQ